MFRQVLFSADQTINNRQPIKVEHTRFKVCPKALPLKSPCDPRIQLRATKEGGPSDMTESSNLLVFNERLECIANDLQPGDTVVCISGSRTQESGAIIVDDMEVHRVIQGPLHYNVHGDTFQEPGGSRICINAVRKGDKPTGIFYQSCILLTFQDKLTNIARWLKSTDTIECHSGFQIMRKEVDGCRAMVRVDDMTVHSVVKSVQYKIRGPAYSSYVMQGHGSAHDNLTTAVTHVPATTVYRPNKTSLHEDSSRYWTHLVFKRHDVHGLAMLRIGGIVRVDGTKQVRVGSRTTVTVDQMEMNISKECSKKDKTWIDVCDF